MSTWTIAQDDKELFPWLIDASQNGGSFLKNLALAGLNADIENYATIRHILEHMKTKYPDYGIEERKRMIADGWDDK